MHAGADRVADPHRAGEIPVEIDEPEHAFAEHARLRQHADRRRHGERAMRDAAAERAGGRELRVDMDRREVADQTGEQIDVALADRPPGVVDAISGPQLGHAQVPFRVMRISASSAFASASRCTSSGPSPMRRNRVSANASARKKSCDSPAPPWI